MVFTGRIILREACLSVQVPGFTADTMAADTMDAVIMAGAMAVITAEVTEAMAAVIMDVAGTKDTKVMAAGATTVVVIKAVEMAVIAVAAATAVVEIAFMGVEANPMAADTVAVGTAKSK
jgi:hypothetical protein